MLLSSIRYASRAVVAVLAVCIPVAAATVLGGCGAQAPDHRDPRALFIMSERYGVNYYLYRDQLEQLGWSVTLAGVADTVATCPPYGDQLGVPPLTVDVLVADVADVGAFDCVALMTSTAYFSDDPFRDVMDSPDAMRLLTDAADAGIPVFASCSAVRVLAAADLIAGTSVVGSPKFQDEFEAAGATFLGSDHPASNTGNIITAARGMYYSVQSMNAVAEAHEVRLGLVEGRRRAPEIALRRVSLSPRPLGDPPAGESPLWCVAVGSGHSDAARAVCATADGGCLVTGYTFGAGHGEADLLVVRLGSDGEELWSRALGGAGMEYGLGCALLDDGFALVGFTTSEGQGGRDAWVVRTNAQGRVLWSRAYGGAGDDVATAVIPVDDGLAVCGHSDSEGEGEEDAFLLLLDADGNELSLTTYGGERSEMANSLHKLDDGGFLLGASTGTYGGGNSNYYMIRTDAAGSELSTASYGTEGPFGHGYDWCTGACRPGDEVVLVGYSDCQDLMDAHVVSLDANGEKLWSVSFGPTIFYDYATSACEVDSGLAVCGASKTFDGVDGVYVLELAPDGTPLGERVFVAGGSCWGSAVCRADARADGASDLFIVGHIAGEGDDLHDALVLRVPASTSS